MIEAFIEFITTYQNHAHWMVFGVLLLAGLNLPISIDGVVAISALVASNVLPDRKYYLLVSCFLGCYFSAWISYSFGRFLGNTLVKYTWFNKLFPASKLEKLALFYQNHGFLTLIIGRFIPFGVRNGIFMTTGMSHLSFATFARRDFLACALWSISAFYLFYSLGLNYETLLRYIKHGNVIIFSLFLVIGAVFFLVYRRKKKSIIK